MSKAFSHLVVAVCVCFCFPRDSELHVVPVILQSTSCFVLCVVAFVLAVSNHALMQRFSTLLCLLHVWNISLSLAIHHSCNTDGTLLKKKLIFDLLSSITQCRHKAGR